MITTSTRAADERDVKALTQPGDSIAMNLLRAGLPLSAVVGGFVYLVSRSLVASLIVGVGLFTASVVSNVRFFRGVSRRSAQNTEAGAVEVFDVQASRVFDIEPVGDNSPAYVFFSSDRKALLVVGQWLLEQNAFPALSFAVSRWSDTGRPIRIETRSPEVEPEPSSIRLPTINTPDIAVLDATPETVQDALNRAFGKR